MYIILYRAFYILDNSKDFVISLHHQKSTFVCQILRDFAIGSASPGIKPTTGKGLNSLK